MIEKYFDQQNSLYDCIQPLMNKYLCYIATHSTRKTKVFGLIFKHNSNSRGCMYNLTPVVMNIYWLCKD